MKNIRFITSLGVATVIIVSFPTVQAAPVRTNLIAQNNSINTVLSQGLEKYKKGDYQGAFVDFDRAVKLNPKNHDIYNKRGAALYKLKEYQRAIADFSQAIKLNPNSAIAYYNRGLIISEELKDNKTALQDYNRAIQLNPKYNIAYFKRGNSHFLLGDRQGAIEDYNRVIQLDGKDADARFNRGVVYLKLNNRQAALKDMQVAADLYRSSGKQEKYRQLTNIIQKLQKQP